MDKRSWPWRKKPSDKGLTSNESGGSSPLQSLKHFDDQVMSGLRLDNIRISDATMLQHQADEKIRHLNERLLAADDLVKQHVKVAEEAVSGWEKAKAEYVSVKHQLDTVVEQKRATEDRVFHLDGALKECMQQLRQTREEQEQKLHEVIIRKTRDWEKLRLEFEERLAHANQQLVEVGHQKNHLYKTVQEQAEAVAELGQARSQAEAEVQMLQVRVETFEKENASLKYEVTILNKELEIRNQEKEINKRSADLASRQHLEGIKKIAKLEAECQRLRGLVRKKLPGPGALVQMKLEVEGLDAEKGEFSNKWRSGGKAASSPKAAHGESILKSESVLSERLLTMEEETKMLKEALAKRNSELHTARLMCARTADKLSTLEGQVGHFQKSPRIPLIGHGPHATEASISLSVSKEPSQASMSEDGNDDERSVADSWASALVTELAYFQKEKATQQQSNKLQQSHKLHEQLDSIVDFIEIERLVSLPLEKQGAEVNTKAEPSPPSISEQVLAKEAELQAANKLCAEVNNKLVAAEAQLSLLRSKNAANELNLFSLQQKLSMILEGNERGDPEKVLEDVKNAVLASRCSSVDGLQAHVMKLSKVSSPGHSSDTPSSLEISPHQQESSPSKCGVGDRIFKIGPEITSGVCKLVRLVEDLASEGMTQHLATTCPEECRHNGVDSDGSPCNIHSTSKSRPLELDTSIRNFITASNQFLHGKVELVQFIADLSSALSQIRKLDSPAVFSSLASRVKKRPEALQDAEQEVFSDAGSPVSRTSNSDGSEQLAAKVLPADVLNSRGLHTDEDLRKVQAEKAALESHMRAEFSRMATVEQMFAQLKQEKIELENTMEEEKEKLETMKGQLLDAEQLVASLRVRLASTELSRNLADEHLSSITAVKAKLESQLEDSQLELTQMHEKLKSFKKSIDLEHARNEELQAKVDELQKILWKPSSSSLQSGANLDAEKSIKEQEIVDATEKLAECQRTILVLGKQLKDIASARDPPLISFNPPADQVQKPSQKDEPAKNANINSTLQKVKQRVSSDPGDCSISDVTDHEISSAVKGGGRGSGTKMSDLLGDKLLAHEGNIQAVSHMPSSPDAEADTQLAKYVPKPAVKKKSSQPFAAIDLSKSLNLDPSSSPRKHGTSFSRFFSRHKNAT